MNNPTKRIHFEPGDLVSTIATNHWYVLSSINGDHENEGDDQFETPAKSMIIKRNTVGLVIKDITDRNSGPHNHYAVLINDKMFCISNKWMKLLAKK